MTGNFGLVEAALASRYQLERELGAGGMATVYLAHDVRHERKVAVKVLRPELAAVLGAERFLQEIKTTAKLHHPQILPLFDSGEADGFLYYVMPYVEGETLRDRLNREKRLAVTDAVAITSAVATALDLANRRGIVHRDIKPENILIQEGVPVVADFGIAVAVASADDERLTATGISVGTPAYMSPEQVAGERDLDGRSDVYALACVTYEMLAGDPPFVASSAQAVMAKHISDVPPPITTTRPEVSPAVAKALAKALSKVPADRHGSAGAFAAALTAEEPADDRSGKSVVVLPFTNQSPDPDNEFFADGLTEEIITDLSRLEGLRVISRNSAMALKGISKDTPTIARQLRVSHVVTGSVRRAGNALRVTAELVEAAADTPLWSDRFTGTVEDVFGIQEEIARKIVAGLELELSPAERRLVAERPIENRVAHDCYLRARQDMYTWTPEALARALRLVDEALTLVGDSPLLLATKAQILWTEVNAHWVPPDVGLDRAASFVDRALALAPDFPLAVFVRGLVAALRGQPERALPDLVRAHELWPGDANVVAELCRFSSTAGLRHNGVFVDRLVEIDPLTPVTWLTVCTYHVVNGRYPEATAAARRAIEMAPDASILHVNSAWHIGAAGFADEACRILERCAGMGGDPMLRSWALFLACARRGDADDALRHLSPELEETMQGNEVTPWIMAQACALIGRTDDALRWLRAAIGRGFVHYPCLMEHDTLLESVRGDPRFRRLMEDLKPRWEALVEWERGTITPD
jgi:serine/threonine-protein kinase